jgi:hypothetical protein
MGPGLMWQSCGLEPTFHHPADVEVNQGVEVRPSQLSTQCGDNLAVGDYFSEPDHVSEVLGGICGSRPQKL